MATGKKISELPVATTLTGLELAVVVQNAETRQTTVEQFAASVSQRLDTFAASTSANFQTVYAQLSANAAAITSVNTVVSALEIRVSSVSAVASANTAAITSINNVVSALEIRVSAVSTQASINAAAITSINAEVSLKAYRSGDYLTNVRYIEFDTSASNGTVVPGKLDWNSNDGTLDLGLYGNVMLQVGQETLFYVKNNQGSPIADGRLVMATSVVGNSGKIAASYADGSGAVSAEYFLGIATQPIPTGDFGYVTHFGLVRGIDATGAPYSETWAGGDLLYPNTSILGGLTKTPPPFPGFSTPIAIVINAAATNVGSIFVRMKTGEYLSQLHDVDISTKASGDIITWNPAVSAWTNSQVLVQTQASVSALNVQVAAVSALTSVNAAAITSINNVVSALEIRVSAVSAAASANAAAITSTNNVVSALEIRVSAVSAVAGTNAAAITSINNVVSALEIRVSSVSAAVSVLTIQVNALDVSAVNARLDTVSAATSVNAAAITSVNAQVSLRVLRSGDTMTGALAIIAGNVSVPGLAFSGDTNTGIYSPAADTLALSTNGIERTRITSSGDLQFNSGYGSVGTVYGCRAWVNFNGTGTVSIRGSGNVSSITDNNIGTYTVNLTNAMPDVNYAVALGGDNITGTGNTILCTSALTTTTFQLILTTGGGATLADDDRISAAVFR